MVSEDRTLRKLYPPTLYNAYSLQVSTYAVPPHRTLYGYTHRCLRSVRPSVRLQSNVMHGRLFVRPHSARLWL